MRRATDKSIHPGVRQKKRNRKRGRVAGSNSLSKKRSPWVLLLLLLLWSICLGCGLGLAMDVKNNPSLPPFTQAGTEEVSPLPKGDEVAFAALGGTVDPVPSRYQLGQQLYLENCSTCHIALPPAVLPSETWRNLIQDEEHYGKKLQPLIGPSILIMWEYLRTFSRSPEPTEKLPYRVSESRYFKALHPRVKLPRNIKITSCVTCHPSAAQFNFRELSPEWENSP